MRFLSGMLLMLLMACQPNHTEPTGPDVIKAGAFLQATAGHSINGVVTFPRESDGIRVQAEVKGLPPNSTHGFHIHQFGDISSTDGMAAGGHYNPTEHPHAGPMDMERHIGDLGNLTSDSTGTARLDFVDAQLSLTGPVHILGRGVIVHIQADDLKTQPTGNAGARVAQGVIGVLKP
jgi:Cu-Zn family superoxide dismutase